MTTLKSIVVSAIVAYASAFQPPSLHSGFIGNAVQQRAASTSCSWSMNADAQSVSRRAALASILAGALAVPVAANAAYTQEKNKARDWQLRSSFTDVQSSSMSGTRTSAVGSSIFSNERTSKKFARNTFTDADLDQMDALQNKVLAGSIIDKMGYKTSDQRIGINRIYGGSSGVYNGGS